MTVYPGYELCKRTFFALAGPSNALAFRVPLVLLAAVPATVVACIGVCPAEAVRIRMVARGDAFAPGGAAACARIVDEDGVGKLFEGLGPLLVRQILFGMMKFFVFDSFAEAVFAAYPAALGSGMKLRPPLPQAVFAAYPALAASVATSLGVSLLSGALAGAVSTVVSQPADVVLSRMAASGAADAAGATAGAGEASAGEAGAGFLETARAIGDEYGPRGFFLGVGPRVLWAAAIISGQFFLYDVMKTLTRTTAPDLATYLDALASAGIDT